MAGLLVADATLTTLKESIVSAWFDLAGAHPGHRRVESWGEPTCRSMQGLPRERSGPSVVAPWGAASASLRPLLGAHGCAPSLGAARAPALSATGYAGRMASESVHIPVLLEEVLEHLRPAPGQVVVDGTLGGGGHARALAERVGPTGRVLALDLDPEPVDRAAAWIGSLPIEPIHASYADLPGLLAERNNLLVDGILLDLGLSSDQLADSDRGFSYQAAGELDMRFNPAAGEPAWRLLERLGERALADLIYQLGDERFSRRIARRIVEQRRQTPIRSAPELAALVRSCVPRSRGHRIDPATRTFQALRIAVNGELDNLSHALQQLPACLKPGGRLAIISFHSHEDRLVKTAFRDDPRLEVVTRRPVQAADAETCANPRARSAKLRVAQRMEIAE